MGWAKDLVGQLTPPIVLAAARRLAGRRAAKPAWTPLEGPYESWAAAVAAADGWEAPAILEKTLQLSLQLQRGEIAFQRDARVLSRIVYSPTILAFIALLAGQDGGRLDIVDVGGSLGTNFQQNRRVLAPFLARGACRWRVVETARTAALGRERFEEPGLAFFDSWRDAIAGGAPKGLLFSSSFQYLEDPQGLLAEAAAGGVETIAFERMMLVPGAEDRIYLQHTEPDRYGGATVAVRASGRAGFEAAMASLGFTLVEEFSGPRQPLVQQPGTLFTRKGQAAGLA
jgi:putative methyltransferase (TIGR04325 family)